MLFLSLARSSTAIHEENKENIANFFSMWYYQDENFFVFFSCMIFSYYEESSICLEGFSFCPNGSREMEKDSFYL